MDIGVHNVRFVLLAYCSYHKAWVRLTGVHLGRVACADGLAWPAMLPDISARITSAGGVCNGAGVGMLGSSSKDCAMTSKTARASLTGSITVQAVMAATLTRTGLVKEKQLSRQGPECKLQAGLQPSAFSCASNCGRGK